MSAPRRAQMTRNRPWRADNPDAVIVDRRTKWGNPFRGDPERAVDAFRRWVTSSGPLTIHLDAGCNVTRVPEWDEPQQLRAVLHELTGRDLACWCPLDAVCHADVLLELANPPSSVPAVPNTEHPGDL